MNDYFKTRLANQTDDVIEKWGKLGFLESIKGENKKKTAYALEITQKYCFYNIEKIHEDVKTLIFPVIIRLFKEDLNEYSYLVLNKVVVKIINDFQGFVETFDFEEYKNDSENKNVDIDAVRCGKFCGEYNVVIY